MLFTADHEDHFMLVRENGLNSKLDMLLTFYGIGCKSEEEVITYCQRE